MKRIPLRACDGSVRAYALVDDEDYEWAMQWRWHRHSKGYAIRSTNSRGKFFLHREIAQRSQRPLAVEEVVHHENECPLDCRRNNLKIKADGGAHRREEHSGRGIGVCFDHSCGRWVAYLDLPGQRRRYLRTHPTRDLALAAVEEARNAIAAAI